jgi:nicotinamidase-related amidase
MFTVIQSLTADGRDRGLDYKISGFHVPPGSFDACVLECITPRADEIVLPKTSSSVFQSTVLDYVLRNLGVTHLILCGCVTDQCVEHAVRDACDLGYLVTLVTGEAHCARLRRAMLCTLCCAVTLMSRRKCLRKQLQIEHSPHGSPPHS